MAMRHIMCATSALVVAQSRTGPWYPVTMVWNHTVTTGKVPVLFHTMVPIKACPKVELQQIVLAQQIGFSRYHSVSIPWSPVMRSLAHLKDYLRGVRIGSTCALAARCHCSRGRFGERLGRGRRLRDVSEEAALHFSQACPLLDWLCAESQ